jgi:hypothetical protein
LIGSTSERFELFVEKRHDGPSLGTLDHDRRPYGSEMVDGAVSLSPALRAALNWSRRF